MKTRKWSLFHVRQPIEESCMDLPIGQGTRTNVYYIFDTVIGLSYCTLRQNALYSDFDNPRNIGSQAHLYGR